jgi:hypothetical protein
MEGTKESFDRLMKLCENAADDKTYEEIAQLLDIDEFINYMAVELHIGNWDWPQNNAKGFRDRNDGKFHFVLFDLDGAFSVGAGDIFNTFFNKEHYRFDTLHGYDYSKDESIEGKRLSGQIELVTLFKNLLANDTFRKKFIDAFCLLGGSVFQQYKVEEIVNEAASYLATGDYVNPWSTANDVMNKLGSRNNSATQALQNCNYMQLQGVERQKVKFSANVEGARVMMNDIEVPYTEFDGYLFSPVTLKAQAPAGYLFKGWKSTGTTQTKSVFTTGENWKYYDKGSLDGTNWKSSTYNDTQWNSGAAKGKGCQSFNALLDGGIGILAINLQLHIADALLDRVCTYLVGNGPLQSIELGNKGRAGRIVKGCVVQVIDAVHHTTAGVAALIILFQLFNSFHNGTGLLLTVGNCFHSSQLAVGGVWNLCCCRAQRRYQEHTA